MANADGSERAVLARASDLGVVKFLPPTASPAGATVAFQAYCIRTASGCARGARHIRWPLYVVDADRGTRPKMIVRSGQEATWSPNGRELAFYDAGALWAVRSGGSRIRRRLRGSRIRFAEETIVVARRIANRLPRRRPARAPGRAA